MYSNTRSVRPSAIRSSINTSPPSEAVGRLVTPAGRRHDRCLAAGTLLAPARSPRLLLLRGLFDPDQSPLLTFAFAEMHHHGGFRLGQIGKAGLVDRLLIVADRPCGALRGLVHSAVNGNCGIAQRVEEVAADRPGLVDGQLKDVVGVGPLALNHGEHPKGKPFLLLARLGLFTRVGDGYGL